MAALPLWAGRAQAQDATTAALPPRPEIDQWVKSPVLTHVCLSPDGGHIAYIREIDNAKTLYTYDIAAKAFKTYVLGKAKISDVFWIDSTHLCVMTLTTEKMEMFAGGVDTYDIVSVYNLAANKINVLFSALDHFKSFAVGGINIIRDKGKTWITAASYRTDGDDWKYLYRFDLDNSSLYELVDRAPWGTQEWVMTPQGELRARSVYTSKTQLWQLQVPTGGGSWKDIFTQTSALDYPNLGGLGRDGKSVVVFMNQGIARGSYYEVAPDGTFSEPLDFPGPNSGPLYDTYSFRLCGTYSSDGWTHLAYFDAKMQGLVERAQKAMDGYRMSLTAYAEDPQRMIVRSEGDDDAGTYYFIDFTTTDTVTIGHDYPDIPAEWLGVKTAIKYKAADGLEIEAYLTLPPNRDAKDLPLVMLPHGGPEARDDLSYDWEAQTYASRGYAVLQPNYRGSEGYGEGFIEKGHGEIGRKMQTDLSDGVRHLASQGIVDLKRVCIVGASYGGYAALAGVTLDPGVYNCAVDVAGISDLTAFVNWSRHYDGSEDSDAYRYWTRYFGDLSHYDAVSPAKNVAHVTAPVLIVHGHDDTVVPFDQSTEMVAALKAAGKDVTFVQYDHEDHWETNELARIDMMKTIVAFIETHNPPR